MEGATRRNLKFFGVNIQIYNSEENEYPYSLYIKIQIKRILEKFKVCITPDLSICIHNMANMMQICR